MLGEVHRVMAARIDVKFMPNSTRSQKFIESHRAGFKAKIILTPTIKINIQACKIRSARNGYWIVRLPENRIGRISKRATQHASPRRIRLRTSKKARQLVYECGAMSAYRRKKLWMA